MGTGTPAVTISGISAADVALSDRGMPEYRWHPGQTNVVPACRLACPSCSDQPCMHVCLRAAFARKPVPIVDNLVWLASRC